MSTDNLGAVFVDVPKLPGNCTLLWSDFAQFCYELQTEEKFEEYIHLLKGAAIRCGNEPVQWLEQIYVCLDEGDNYPDCMVSDKKKALAICLEWQGGGKSIRYFDPKEIYSLRYLTNWFKNIIDKVMISGQEGLL